MRLIECGKITSTHGVKGELKIDPWCDGAQFLSLFESFRLSDGTVLNLRSWRVHKDKFLAIFEGINSIDLAEPFLGKVIFIDRDAVELPEGSYFIADLIGLEVYDADTDELYGKLTDVMQNGPKDIYKITAEKRELLFPAIPEIIIRTDLKEKKMFIRPLEGLFDL